MTDRTTAPTGLDASSASDRSSASGTPQTSTTGGLGAGAGAGAGADSGGRDGAGGDPAIRVRGLKKYFTEDDSLIRRLRPDQSISYVRAVDGVDLTIERGDTVGLVGESGCGKSTLARAVLQLIEPTEGSVEVNGVDVTDLSGTALRSFRSEAQMIFQDPFSSLNPRYTVRKTLVEPMTVHGIGDSAADRDERAARLLERVGLEADQLDRYPHEFSGGQRQRVAIARALSVEPEIVVADEPVSALDASVQAQILNLLRELKREMDLTMLFISHDLSVVRQICDRVAVMYLGEIVEEAPTRDLFTDPQHPYSEVLVSSIPVPDPTVERERIELAGDVPTPIDPPSGCRFHPRCPKVVPPDGWAHDQAAWRRVLHYRTRLERGEVEPAAKREQLESEAPDGETVTHDDVVDALYAEHVTEGGIQSADLTMPAELRDRIRESIARLAAGDGDPLEPVAGFDTVCETERPRRLETGDRLVACHLRDPDVDTSDADVDTGSAGLGTGSAGLGTDDAGSDTDDAGSGTGDTGVR